MASSEGDFELLQRWKDGDRQAGGVVIERHFKKIQRFFTRKVSDQQLIQELAQRTFARCTKRIQAFESRSSFSSFLFGIARNILLEYFREVRRDGRSTSIDVEKVPLIDLDPSPFTVLEIRADRKLLINVLRRLPLDDQILAELYFFESLPAPEICEILGIAEPTLRARIRSRRQRVQELIEELAESPEQLKSTLMTLDGWARSVKEAAQHNGRNSSPASGIVEVRIGDTQQSASSADSPTAASTFTMESPKDRT